MNDANPKSKTELSSAFRLVFVFAIIIIAINILWNTGLVPSDMEGDGIIHSIIADNYAYDRAGNDGIFQSGTFYLNYAYLYPLWHMLTALMFKLFGSSLVVLARFVYLIGVLTVIVFYRWQKVVFDKDISLIVTFLMCSSLWFLPAWCGTGFFVFLIFLSVSIVFAYYQLKVTGKNSYLFLCAASIAMALYNGYAHILIVFPILFLSNLWIEKGWKRLFDVKLVLIFVLSLCLYFVVLAVTCRSVYHFGMGDYYKQVSPPLSLRMSYRATHGIECIKNNLWWYVREIFYRSGSDENSGFNVYKILGYPLLSRVTGVLFLLGWVVSWVKRDVIGKILNVWLFVTVVFYALVVQPTTRYLITLLPCFYIFAGIGLGWLKEQIVKKAQKPTIFGLLLLVVLFSNFSNFRHGYKSYFKHSFNLEEQYGMSEICDFIEKDSGKNKENIIICTYSLKGINRPIRFYSQRRLEGKTVWWGKFKQFLKKNKYKAGSEDMVYFVFPAPNVNIYGKKSEIFEFKKMFPGLDPRWIVYFHNKTECRYIYRLRTDEILLKLKPKT